MSRTELGTDFYCADDITSDWREADSPEQAYIQAMYRRLYLSSLFYDNTYGLGVERKLLDIKDDDLLRREITAELLKDERTSIVTVAFSNNQVLITATPHDAPSFPLTLTIDRVSGALVKG